MMYWWYGDHINGVGYAMMLVVWGLIITAGVLLVRTLGRGEARRDRARPPAEQLLAERYARGEIDEQEYYHRLHVLHAAPRPGVGA
ncbi:MAG: hypothetical protein JWN35_1782 [Frankiales bacterium]|nr:hypothetical protein [Frankiales bacterium]